jgi:hypothetical protein
MDRFTDTTVNKKAQHLYAAARALLPTKVELVCVDYRENFHGDNDLLRQLVTGNVDALTEGCWEWYAEQRYETARHEATEAVEKARRDVDDWDTDTEEIELALVDELLEVDTSDPMEDLLRNTGDVWVRVPYEDPTEELPDREILVQVPARVLWEFWTAIEFRNEPALLVVEGAAMVGTFSVSCPFFDDAEVQVVLTTDDMRRAKLDGVSTPSRCSTWHDYVGGLCWRTEADVYAITLEDESAEVLTLAQALAEVRRPGVPFSEMLKAAEALAA